MQWKRCNAYPPLQAHPGKLSDKRNTVMAVLPIQATMLANISHVQFHMPEDITGEREREAIRSERLGGDLGTGWLSEKDGAVIRH